VYGTVAPAVNGLPSVVLLWGDGAGPAAPQRPPTMDQIGLQFAPRTLVVPLGDTIVFTNSESIAHNVDVRPSDGGESILSTDTPPNGRATLVIDQAGAYDVTCEIHPGMSAMIFATDARYAAVAAVDGSFHVTDVAPGRYTLRVWSQDEGARIERTIEVQDGQALEVAVDGS
jgi:plastocyanin